MRNTNVMRMQVREFIQNTIYGYLNGCEDAGYEPMTEQGYIDYVFTTLELEKDIVVNGLEARHLRFYGKENITAEIKRFIHTDEWVKQWLKED